MSRIVTTALVAATILAASGCDRLPLGRADGRAGGAADLTRVQGEIDHLTQPPLATRAASCRALAYGSKACGGPSRVVVYSAERTDTTRLAALAERFTRLEDAHNRSTGAASDCMYLSAPPVRLTPDGVCAVAR